MNDKDRAVLEKAYISGPAAFSGAHRLAKTTGYPIHLAKEFLAEQNSYTKYHVPPHRFPRLKVIAYRINEIWGLDVAYVDKLAKHNRDVKYLLLAVDILSRYVRVEPLKSKTSKDASAAFKKMIKRKQPEKVWTDKGTEFKGEFKTLCDKKGIAMYTTNSETKSAYAERQIRSLKTLIYKYLEKKWTWSYIDKLQDFVKTINTRVNRVTKLAPYKVTKKDVPRLLGDVAQQSNIKKPKFKIGHFVRIAKEDLPFKKGYKQNYTDEVFEITNIPTVNPPTYSLIDALGEKIGGKFYEPELMRVSHGSI